MKLQTVCKRCGKRYWNGYGPDNGGEDICEECVENNQKPK